MNARDELALELKRIEGYHTTINHFLSYHREVATDLLAAGYSKPRTITTVEELDAALAGTIIRDSDPLPCIKWGSGYWGTFSGNCFPASSVALPATVLHEPHAA